MYWESSTVFSLIYFLSFTVQGRIQNKVNITDGSTIVQAVLKLAFKVSL